MDVGAGLVLVSGPTTCPGFLDRRGLLVLARDDGTIPAGLGLITEGSRGWLKGIPQCGFVLYI